MVDKQVLENEILSKIEEMEKPEYAFPERFPKKSFIAVLVCVLVSLGMLVIGAFL
ncbi:MAG: hypothetical protein IJM25_06435 [Eubacterium sp.]|nr:hypothetical protein [Eubacterium sp.]